MIRPVSAFDQFLPGAAEVNQSSAHQLQDGFLHGLQVKNLFDTV
jgi:hypothetical protein